jgi:transposase-like protein
MMVAGQGDIAYLWAWTIKLREEDGRWPGREAEVVNPTLSEKANSIKYVRYPVGLESLCQVKTFSGFAIKLQ